MVWWLALIYLLVIAAELGPIFFGPILIADAFHLSNVGVGIVMGATSLVGAVAMLLNSVHSDRSGERIAHAVVPMLVVTLGFVVAALVRHPAGIIAGITLIALGVNALLPVPRCIPSMLFRGGAAAGGIAVINSIGNLGGFLAPAVLGAGKESSGSYARGLLALGALAFLSALFIVPVGRAPALAQRRLEPNAR